MTNSTHCPRAMPVTYAVLETIVAIVAVFGNTIVILAFCVEKKLRKLTNYYILSLSVADLLVGLIGVPSALLTKVGLPMDAFHTCLAMLSVLVVLCTVSILNLLSVSIDRYWAIIYPFWYHTRMNGKVATCVILGSWLLGSVLGFLPLFGWNNGPEESGLCLFIPIISYKFLVLTYFLLIVLPGLVMAFSYFRIYRIVLRQLRKTLACRISSSHHRVSANNSNCSTTECKSSKAHGKSCRSNCSFFRVRWKEISKAKDLSIIVLFFMICWFPLFTCNCILAFCNGCHLSVSMMEFFIVLSHANSAVNPFLYACQMKDFRMGIKNLLTHKRSTKENNDTNSNSNQVTRVCSIEKGPD